MLERLKEFILQKVFVVSKQPVLLKDLLEANSLINEGMLVDPAKLNFKFRYGSLYAVYSVICALALTLILLIFHGAFSKIDFHYSIFGSVVMTSTAFVGFDFFKIWARKQISLKCLKNAWQLHFPYFAYEKYSQKIDEIYDEAMKDEISRRDLEKYVLDKLVASIG